MQAARECDFRVARGGLPEKVAFVQRLEGGKFKAEKFALFVTEKLGTSYSSIG